MTNLILESGTKRLLDLTSNPYRSDDDVQTILSIINTLAPNLLGGLTEANCSKIAKGAEIRCYQRDQVLFRQGDSPDAYYTVIRGAVSIYARSGDARITTSDATGGGSIGTCRDGKFLCQLPPGASFGELSFNANGMHSPRNAGVVSDGSHGQSKVMIRSDGSRLSGVATSTGGKAGDGGIIEVEASDVAVLLCIPEALYMKELFPRHAAKHSTKEKLDFLRSSFLFQHWTADQLIKLAYAMKKKTFADGTVIAREGDHVECIYMIRRGRVKLQSAIKGGNSSRNFPKQNTRNARTRQLGYKKRPLGAIDGEEGTITTSETLQGIDIAFLGDGEMLGLVEAATKSKKMRRTIITTKCTDMFVVPIFAFHSFLVHQDKTKAFIDKMADKRRHWQALRLDYATKFPTMPRSLPRDWKQMSSFILHPDSILTETERRQQNEMQTIVNRKLREARALHRAATTEAYCKKRMEELAKAKTLCQEARDGTSGAFRCEKKIVSFLKEVAEVEKMITCKCRSS
jgi:CRP-like cAMP-binding protein